MERKREMRFSHGKNFRDFEGRLMNLKLELLKINVLLLCSCSQMLQYNVQIVTTRISKSLIKQMLIVRISNPW